VFIIEIDLVSSRFSRYLSQISNDETLADPLKDVRPADALIELRGTKEFNALPSTSEWAKKDAKAIGALLQLKGMLAPCSVGNLYHLVYFFD
jgi:hypothetical protein